jgi:hypothetical protein
MKLELFAQGVHVFCVANICLQEMYGDFASAILDASVIRGANIARPNSVRELKLGASVSH